MHMLKYLDEIRPVDEIPEIAQSKQSKPDPQEILWVNFHTEI